MIFLDMGLPNLGGATWGSIPFHGSSPRKNGLSFDLLNRFCYDWANSSFPQETFSLDRQVQAFHLGRGIRMRGDPLARQWRIIRAIEASPSGLTVTEIAQREAPYPRYHAKAQRAPSEISRLLLSSLDIFLTPSYSIRKTINGIPARPPLRPLRLGVRKGF